MSTGTFYKVNINGFADKSLNQIIGCKLYVLENQNAVNSILDKEIAEKIKKVLISEGYIISKPNEADFFISFNYGISNHKETLTFKEREPGHFEQKSRVYAYNITKGTEYKYYYDQYIPGQVNTVNQEITVFDRFLFVKVFPAKDFLNKKNISNDVWICETTSSGSSNDIRVVIDYLIVPTFKNFGVNTGEIKTLTIAEDHEEMKVIR